MRSSDESELSDLDAEAISSGSSSSRTSRSTGSRKTSTVPGPESIS